MRPGDRHRLGVVETDDLYDNAIHSTMGCILSIYLAKEHEKALKREFRALVGERNLLLDVGQWLTTRVDEVEGIMKETLQSIDNLQVDMDVANAAKVNLEGRAKAAEDQVAELQWQIQKL